MKQNAEVMRKEGDILFQEQRYEEAIEKYSTALKLIDHNRILTSLLNNTAVALSSSAKSVSDDPAQYSSINSKVAVYASGAYTIDPTFSKADIYLDNALKNCTWTAKHELHSTDRVDVIKLAISVSECLSESIEDFLLLKQHDMEMQLSSQPTSSPLEFKAKGNEAFTSGEYVAACDFWSQGLHALMQSEGIVQLLCNRSLCLLRLSLLDQALLNAAAAIVCEPTSFEAHYRRAEVLLALERPLLALEAIACSQRLGTIPGDQLAIHNLQAKIMADVDEEKQQTTTAITTKPSKEDLLLKNRLNEFINQRPAENQYSAIEIDLPNMQKMNAKFASAVDPEGSFMVDRKSVKLSDIFDRRIVNFPDEFLHSDNIPSGCESTRCRKNLVIAYECARSCRRAFWGFVNKRRWHTELMMHRFRGLDTETIDWYCEAAMGDVNLSPTKHIYDPREMHCFSNAANRTEGLEIGTTNVAIGFVDLGLPREAEFFATDPSLLLPPIRQPTRWIGFEASPYCVAKTIIIATMLQMSSPVDSVLQVWYSAAWSLTTLTAFRSAVTSILSGSSSSHSGLSHEEVRLLLRHWHTASVDLTQARQGWLDGTPDIGRWSIIGNFTKKSDRVALCSYFLTGQLLPATVGSVTFFSFPPNYWGKMAGNQCVFESIKLEHVINQRLLDGSGDIVAAAINYLRGGIHRLQNQLVQGLLVVEVRLLILEATRPSSLAEVAALDPHTISWSNVCDYYRAADFHAMAQACSGSNTIHYAYSMNWPAEVKGASVLDYVLPSDMNGLSDEALSALISGLMPNFLDRINMQYVLLRSSEFMMCPPVDDFRNIFDFGCYCKRKDKWLDSFFSVAGLSDQFNKRYFETEVPLYSPLHRTNSTLYFTFTYDPDIQMFDLNPSNYFQDPMDQKFSQVESHLDYENPQIQTIIQNAAARADDPPPAVKCSSTGKKTKKNNKNRK